MTGSLSSEYEALPQHAMLRGDDSDEHTLLKIAAILYWVVMPLATMVCV